MQLFRKSARSGCGALLGAMLLASLPARAASPVTPISAANLTKQVASSKGQVVLVNFWATWCPPCVAEFPGLVQLQKKYGKNGLKVIFVSGDDVKTQKSKVEPFVKKYGARSYIINGNPIDFIKQFDPKLQSSFGLPRTYLYNRQGKLVAAFSEDKSYAEFEKQVKPLLKK